MNSHFLVLNGQLTCIKKQNLIGLLINYSDGVKT